MARIVSKGIRVDNDRGSAIAWSYLSQRDISTAIIFRVLSDPSMRRPMDLAVLTVTTQTPGKPIFRLSANVPRKQLELNKL